MGTITPEPHQFLPGGHSFDRICREYGLEHRLTKSTHPWTNDQVERMNRTLKDATVHRFHYQTTDEFNEHLQFAGLQPRQALEYPTRANSVARWTKWPCKYLLQLTECAEKTYPAKRCAARPVAVVLVRSPGSGPFLSGG